MNILSNILKIDYSLYIINDEKIKKEMINACGIYLNDCSLYNNIILIKYNNSYYLHYLNIGRNTGYIYLYDDFKEKYTEILNYDNNKKYLIKALFKSDNVL